MSPTRNRPLNIFLGLVLPLVSLLLLLALATYHASDPSLNTATDLALPHAVQNWVGLFGAYLSDLLLQVLGVTAFLLPLWMGGWAGHGCVRDRAARRCCAGPGPCWPSSLLPAVFGPAAVALALAAGFRWKACWAACWRACW